ncbi:MAG: MltA domain-containing protein [Kofleriaceae bacterium]
MQPLRASHRRGGAYQWPLYRRPPDLVEVFLSDFIADGRGRRIWGQVDAGGHLRRYPTRGELRASRALVGHELVWVDDPVDAIYAQIEGSARAELDDGSVVWLNFDGKNGRGFKGVGKILRDAGHLRPGHGSMQDIRAYFAAHPGEAEALLDQNTSMVFFTESPGGALGSQGVVLTAGRSVAVDRALIATPRRCGRHLHARRADGATSRSPGTAAPSSAPVRVDIYLGHDADAVDLCGRLNFPARTWLLLPRGVTTR